MRDIQCKGYLNTETPSFIKYDAQSILGLYSIENLICNSYIGNLHMENASAENSNGANSISVSIKKSIKLCIRMFNVSQTRLVYWIK